jgi:uncharacterized protein
MTSMLSKAKLVVAAVAVTAAGCSPLAPRPDYSKYFILTPLSTDPDPASTATTNATSHLVIGIGPIDFPDYLRRAQVVTRVAPNRIDLSQQDRWAEPLDKNFARILTENLARSLNTQRIERYPWSRRTQVDYQVVIDVQRFETTANSQSQLIARWIIKDGQSGEDLYASETVASAPVAAGDTGASAALSSDLGRLSTEIATRVATLTESRRGISRDKISLRPAPAASSAATMSTAD